MSTLLIVFFWFLNFGISWWNSYACGRCWAETKAVGGWRHFMAWMGAIMAASGFTWCIMLPLVLGANQLGFLNAEATKVTFELGYILIVPGILFSGLMITLDSWAQAFRQGGVLNYGVAAYNTYAQIHNTLSAIETFGTALKDVGSFFEGVSSGDSDSENGGGIVVLIVVALLAISVAAGVILTTVIIRKTAAREPLLTKDEMRAVASK
jgi:hypothetical protein